MSLQITFRREVAFQTQGAIIFKNQARQIVALSEMTPI